MSTTGVSPVTVMVSVTEPTFRSAFTVAANDPVSSMPSRLQRIEAGQRERHGVDAAAQLLDPVLPAAVGHDGAGFLDQGRAGRFDGDARQHGARASRTMPAIDAEPCAEAPAAAPRIRAIPIKIRDAVGTSASKRRGEWSIFVTVRVDSKSDGRHCQLTRITCGVTVGLRESCRSRSAT